MRYPATETELLRFFNQLGKEWNTAGDLDSFFRELSKIWNSGCGQAFKPKELASFFDFCSVAIDEAVRSGEFLNVWTIAGLSRDELRNVSVLSWLFNCHETHGQRSAFLHAFLRRLKVPAIFPNIDNLDEYSTFVEKYPLGDKRTRVDIEIDADGFLIFIEAKIDAPEGRDQIPRLVDLAAEKARAFNRPHAVIFLCLERHAAAARRDGVTVATWNDVASSIYSWMQRNAVNGSLRSLVQQYAFHVSQL